MSTLHAHLVFVTRYRRGVLDDVMLTDAVLTDAVLTDAMLTACAHAMRGLKDGVSAPGFR
jgi:hypothetical protein